MKNVFGIVAVDSNWGIAKDNKIPWHYPVDFKHFKKTTEDSVCFMGYNTYLELASLSKYPEKNSELLKGRKCTVLTSHHKASVVESESCHVGKGNILEMLKDTPESTPKFVIGGSKLYLQMFGYCEGFYVTELKQSFDCNVIFPEDTFKENFLFDHELYSDEDMVIKYYKKKSYNSASVLTSF